MTARRHSPDDHKQVHVYLPLATVEAIDYEANSRRVSRAQVMREALERLPLVDPDPRERDIIIHALRRAEDQLRVEARQALGLKADSLFLAAEELAQTARRLRGRRREGGAVGRSA